MVQKDQFIAKVERIKRQDRRKTYKTIILELSEVVGKSYYTILGYYRGRAKCPWNVWRKLHIYYFDIDLGERE